ncbi:hypothetical protein BJV82DRAFT_243117 [Fennellomyces sp. T-0311]|nr:hypothetical protein BJV82DRAFT_243117 [Fennellomyces sp. T-0311]
MNDQFKPFMYGVGFPGADESTLLVQAGDGGTNEMTKVVRYNVSGAWSSYPMQHGQAPSARAAMTVVYNSSGSAFFYGGRTQTGSSLTKGYFNDFYTFDSNTATWTWPDIRYGWGKAPPRYDHSAVLIQDKVFVFGGTTNVGGSPTHADFGSVLVFDTIENKAVSMATIGDIPPPRLQFSAAAAPDGKSIVVFGGLNTSSPDAFDSSPDIFVLDTCKLEWTKPDIGGDIPEARASHGVVTYGNYMIVLYGYTNMGTYAGTKYPIYTKKVDILDMHSWKWVRSISHQDNPTAKADAGCTFSFPKFPDDTSLTQGDHPMEYDPTVIANPNKASNGARNKGLAIGLSIFGILLIIGGFFFYRRRQRKKARALNPRWLPGAITSHKGGANNDYPLFVYNNADQKDATDEKKPPRLSLDNDSDGMRTYTANDHDNWARALDQDPERPEDGRPMSRHTEVWERMRSLHDQRNT